MVHAGGIRSWGTALPWAWPRDGRREMLEGAGIALAEQYGAQGLNMLYQHAQFEDGSVSVEAGLMQMLTRMETGKFQGLQSAAGLVRGIPALPPQGRKGRQGRRRFAGSHALRRDDAALCRDDLSETREVAAPALDPWSFVDGHVMCHRPKLDPDRMNETCSLSLLSKLGVCGGTAGCCPLKPHGCTTVGNARRLEPLSNPSLLR